ncbi:hypothetical protein [Nitrosomonas sp. Nm58]|uniref:hypothetical protein n=1 Tax=Nitrosomonas sp. Nm58 TaxID=200126 RepID=UPI00115FC4D6|nr:hypothetical protein [Nitrosomonas sp. Nm58]
MIVTPRSFSPLLVTDRYSALDRWRQALTLRAWLRVGYTWSRRYCKAGIKAILKSGSATGSVKPW